MLDWMKDHRMLLSIIGGLSIAIFIASFFIIPALVARIEPNYFAHDKRPPSRWIKQHQIVQVLLRVGKNLLGVVLIVAGLAMLVLPGPGLVTALIGFFLIDFPGKYRFERWLIARPPIRRSVDWFRKRAGRVPLQIK